MGGGLCTFALLGRFLPPGSTANQAEIEVPRLELKELAQGDGDHVGVERYWSKRGTASSSRPVIFPRLGLESEVVPHILRLRAGSYYEPERFNLTPARVHGTGGFEERLFEWDVCGRIKPFGYWQLSIEADAARAYLNTSFSIGFWH